MPDFNFQAKTKLPLSKMSQDKIRSAVGKFSIIENGKRRELNPAETRAYLLKKVPFSSTKINKDLHKAGVFEPKIGKVSKLLAEAYGKNGTSSTQRNLSDKDIRKLAIEYVSIQDRDKQKKFFKENNLSANQISKTLKEAGSFKKRNVALSRRSIGDDSDMPMAMKLNRGRSKQSILSDMSSEDYTRIGAKDKGYAISAQAGKVSLDDFRGKKDASRKASSAIINKFSGAQSVTGFSSMNKQQGLSRGFGKPLGTLGKPSFNNLKKV